jgi:uncharacterized protein (DUF2237 family)
VLDLEGVTLVDLEVVQFLATSEAKGMDFSTARPTYVNGSEESKKVSDAELERIGPCWRG